MRKLGARLSRAGRAGMHFVTESAHELAAKPKVSHMVLGAGEQRILDELRASGVVAIPGYWTPEAATTLRERMRAYLETGMDRDFEGGAYLRCWTAEHPKASLRPEEDRGISRLYHIDKLVPELAAFRFDPLVLNIATAYYGVPMYSGMLQFQHNAEDTHSTRYFHVDAFHKEFKAFLYLDDVDESNGPFTYLKGSHRAWGVRLKRQFTADHARPLTSFSPEEVGAFLTKEVLVTGPAGTLILADVRGLHRGSPQRGSSRSVLVNYIYDTPGEYRPDR